MTKTEISCIRCVLISYGGNKILLESFKFIGQTMFKWILINSVRVQAKQNVNTSTESFQHRDGKSINNLSDIYYKSKFRWTDNDKLLACTKF